MPTAVAAPSGARPRALPVPGEADLLELHRPLAAWIVKRTVRRPPPPLTWGDVHSAAMLGLLLAIRQHDPARGALSTIASLLIRRELARLWTEGISRRRRPGHVHIVQGSVDENGAERVLELTDDRAEADLRAADARLDQPFRLLDGLPDRARAAFLAVAVDALTLADVGRDLGVSRQRVEQLVRRVRDRARRARPGRTFA